MEINFAQLRRSLSYTVWILIGVWAVLNWFIVARNQSKINNIYIDEAFKSLSREKRFIYMNNDRRFSLPEGSVLAFSGILSLPFLGNLPIGYGSALTVAVPLTFKFDELGMTHEDNRFGYFDFMNVTEMLGIPPINISALRLPSVFEGIPPHPIEMPSLSIGSRGKRNDWSNFPGVNYAGGDRKIVYKVIGEFLSSFVADGSACVQRAICEMHEETLMNNGFFGEALKLLLSPSLAPLAEYRLGPYLQAEEHAKTIKDCRRYHSQCKHSIFSPKNSSKRKAFNSTSNLKVSQSVVSEAKFLFDNQSNIPRRRKKRFFMIGPHRNIIFPPTTAFVVTPTLNLPFMRDLPEGFFSEISYSVPFTFSFDDLGLTSALNTFGFLPFLKRKKRSVKYLGGDREIIYAVIADVLNNIGLNGHGCLLRTICEVHEMPLVNHGLFGEYFHLLLTPSFAIDAESRLSGFVNAEKLGRNCGDCSDLFKVCPKSFFTNPGAGQQFSTEEERRDCRMRHNFDFRKENNNFVQNVKLKLSQNYPEMSSSSKFAQDISKKINFQHHLRRLK